MHSYLAWARAKERHIIEAIREMVECESPTESPAAVNRQVDQLCDRCSDDARVERVPASGHGDHLLLHFQPAANSTAQLLVLGHTDTVWPLGTLGSMPFREADGRLYGPGVLDMKAGIAFFLFAMECLREHGVSLSRRVVLQLNSEEETGSKSSRELTERTALASEAVLVLEPGTGLTGKLKTARKGIGSFEVKVHGRAAHAGVDFEAGANAIVELSRQVIRIAAFTDLDIGLTVNPGVMRGGTKTNVVPAEATVAIDARIARARDMQLLDTLFQGLEAVDPRCRLEVTGGLNRPPMERTRAIAALFETAREIAASFGIELEESSTGGGSDGNFTAALGVPTLDGLGAVGEGAHAAHESILIERIADRTALLAALVEHLCRAERRRI